MTTIKELKALHKQQSKIDEKIMVSRGHEYANDEDTLQTFRDAAQIFGKCSGPNGECTPSDVCRMQLTLKNCRLKKKYKFDTVVDIRNYGFYMILLEDNPKII